MKSRVFKFGLSNQNTPLTNSLFTYDTPGLSPPPPGSQYLLAENGDFFITESGDFLVTE